MLSRRWLGLAVVVALLAVLGVRLGLWQLSKSENRKATNAITAANLDAPPVPWTEVMRPGRAPAPDDSYRRVQVTGTYDTSEQATVKYQTRDQGPGVDVVTPLVTADGTAVLVDRGWLGTDNTPDQVDVPLPPTGTVTVTGWLLADSGADRDATTPTDGQVRAVSSAGFAPELSYPVAGGHLALLEQTPPSAVELAPPEAPDLGQGPHFFYGLQWFFFGLLAVVGWFWFAWAEAHPRPARRTRSDEDDPGDPGDTDDHDDHPSAPDRAPMQATSTPRS